MPITETVLLKAAGSGLMRTIGIPLKASYNVTDVNTLRLKNGATILSASFTVGARWDGIPSDPTKPIKWVHVTFKDTSTPRNLTIDDAGGTIPAQSNPLVVTNNASDITISNGIITTVFNKVTDAADLLTSFLLGASEVLHTTNKPRLTVPVEKRTALTWTSSQYDFAAVPTDSTIKVGNAALFSVGEQVNIEWEGAVADYFPTGGADSHPFIIMAQPFTLPDMTRALMDAVHKVNIILDYGGGNHIVPIDYSQSQGFCLESAPPVTPTPGMKIRIQEVENTTTKTIQSINAGANTITFTTTLGQYVPQGVYLEPLIPASSTATANIISGGTVIEKQYGDKAVIIKQTCHLKDSGARIEPNLFFEIRSWMYADTGFVRQQITIRNTVETLTTAACPPVLFNALQYDFPTALAATPVSDSVTDMTTSVNRYKANNLHTTLAHSAINNFQWAIHEFQVQWPNIASVNATGCHFEIFPASMGPISFEGGVIKSRNLFFGLNASNGFPLLDSLAGAFDGDYVALTQAVRPNMVGKRDWNTFFASEPQKFKDACQHFERIVACWYDITQAEASFATRPAMSLYEYRWDYVERSGSGTYCFGWDRFGNTPDDVGFGNNRFDAPYILFREGLRETTLAKAQLAFQLGLQQIRNRSELGQHWSHQSQATGTPDMYGLARYERAYAPDPFNYTNSPLANPTHSWNEGTCLAWALTDEPLLYEAARAGVLQARQYNYQGTANALLYGSGTPQMGSLASNGGGAAEPRFVGWPIHTLIVGYRYFGESVDLQRAQDYCQSFIATMAAEAVQDGFIDFAAGGTRAPLFQHGGYCVMGMIETWRDTPAGATKTAIGDYIVKVAKFLQRGDYNLSSPGPDAPMLTAGKPHPSNATLYNPASHMPFTYARSYSDTLSGAISASDTTIPLNNASTFNLGLNIKRGVIIPATQVNNPSSWEYFTYTGVSGNTLTGVARGHNGTTAQAFPAGAIVYPTAFNTIENDLVIATLIMGARISGDATLQQFAQTIWEDNCLYTRRVDGGNPTFVTIGNYYPINLWPLGVSTNGLKAMAQMGISLSEFLGDRVNPPTGPSLTSLAPNSATAGAAQFTLTLNGANFTSDAQVKWNTTDLVTTFVNANQVTAVVPAALIASAGSATVTVLNVTDNLMSNGQTFTINPAAPGIASLVPNTALVGVATGVITITGTALAGATVTVDGNSVTPTSNSATQIVLPSQTFANTGNKTIVITTAGGSANTSIAVSNPAPVLSGINPSTASAGAAQFTLTLTGTGFVSNSIARWNGTDLTTTYVSPSQLTAVIPANLLTTTGTINVTVFSPTPGGGASGSSTFTISAAATPTIASLSPSSVIAGGAQFTLTVNGANFTSDAEVRVGGAARATTFVNATQVSALIPASDIASAGVLAVSVRNVSTGALSSDATLSVQAPNPTPTATTLVPASVTAGATGFTLEVSGTNFISTSIIRVNGVDRNTTYVDNTHLTCPMLASEVASVGTLSIRVFTPAPGGGLSAPLTLTVTAPQNPAPTLSSISPTSTTAGAAQLTLTVNGQSFTNGAVVRWNGSDLATTFVNAQQLTATIPANLLSSAGSRNVTVFNPSPGGGVSNAVTFTIDAALSAPAPTLTTLSPNSVLAGGAQFTLTVNGQNFASDSVVRVNTANRTTSFVGTTQLTTSIPASDIVAAGVLSITVLNADGQTSNAISLPVNAVNAPTIASLSPATISPGAAGFTLAVLGANFTNTSQIQINGVARMTTYISSARLETVIAANEVASAGNLAVSVTTAGVGTSTTLNLPIQNVGVNLPKLTPAFKAGKATLRIEQGKTFQAPIKVTIGDSIADLQNVTAVMQLRRKVADEELNALPLLELSTTNGGLVVDAVNGYLTINMSATQTGALRFARCLFEIEATTQEGIVVGILRGDVRVTREVVR